MGDGLECAAIANVFGCNEAFIEQSSARDSSGNNGPAAADASNDSRRPQRLAPVAVSSTKGAVGHLLGAAGAVEAVFTVLAVSQQRCPPTVNLTRRNIDKSLLEYGDALTLLTAEPAVEARGRSAEDTKYRVMQEMAGGVEMRVRAAMTNSFGFGGTNATLLFAENTQSR